MSRKVMIMFGMIIGSFAAGCLPGLLGADGLSPAPLLGFLSELPPPINVILLSVPPDTADAGRISNEKHLPSCYYVVKRKQLVLKGI